MSEPSDKQSTNENTQASSVSASTPIPTTSSSIPPSTKQQSEQQSQSASTTRPVSTPSNNPTSNTNSEVPFNLNRLVLEYLTRKGFHQTEATLRIESTKIPGAQTFNLNNSNSNYSNPSIVNSDRSNLQFQQQQYLIKQNVSKQRQFDQDPKMFSRAYILYRSWCENSLEMYKYELERLLYPFFIYSYLTLIQRNDTNDAHNFLLKFKSDHLLSHNQEIKNLLSITLPDHLTENKYANLFLNNKYKLTLSNTSLNLILGFLNENQAIGGGILVRFLNNNFEIHTQLEVATSANDNLDNLEGIPEIYQLVNLGPDHDNENFKSSKSNFQLEHEKPLKLGPYPNDEEFTKELEAELKHKDENAKKNENIDTNINNKNDGHNNDHGNDENIKSNKSSKPTLMDEYNENFKIDPKNEDSPARGTLPLPQKTVYDLKRAIQEIQDSRSRIKLTTSSYSHLNNNSNNVNGNNQRNVYISQPSLPSVCMYTFHNTNNDLTTLEYHPDSTIIAGGFQDSFIKLWSIDGSPLRSILKTDPYNQDIDYNDNDSNHGLPNSTSRKLIGHSGPVYGLSFSPDGNYLLSSSADSTVRLWSLDTYSALVSYKGHGGAGGAGGSSSPVWDVQFSPLGHYFATASHDQTARLWSCDHIYPLRIFAGHLNDVDIVKFHPNGTYLFTGSSDKTVRMWDVARAESVRLFVGHTSPISDIACSPDGRWLATASVNEENYLNTSFGINDWANNIGGGFTPSGASNRNNQSDNTNNTNNNNNDKSSKGKDDINDDVEDDDDDIDDNAKSNLNNKNSSKNNNANTSNNNNNNNNHINNNNNTNNNNNNNSTNNSNNNSTTTNNNNNNNNNNSSSMSFTGSVIHVWDIASGRKLKTMRGHGTGGIHSLAWSRGGEVLVSGGADGSVRVWDAKKGTVDSIPTGQPERFIPVKTNSIKSSNDLKENNTTINDKNSVVNNYGSNDHMAVYFTKKTPVYKVEFTRRNLCLAAGPYMG